jgi:hypothetical protein
MVAKIMSTSVTNRISVLVGSLWGPVLCTQELILLRKLSMEKILSEQFVCSVCVEVVAMVTSHATNPCTNMPKEIAVRLYIYYTRYKYYVSGHCLSSCFI